MWRYPDGTFKRNPPAKMTIGNVAGVKFNTLTVEEQDELGYNEAQPAHKKEPFTTYETEWVKDGFIYIENIVSETVDEVAKADFERRERIQEIEAELSMLDLYVPRSVEDQIDNEDCPVLLEHLTEWNQDRLSKKTELRTELSFLSDTDS